jgi:hypothetical protein
MLGQNVVLLTVSHFEKLNQLKYEKFFYLVDILLCTKQLFLN